MRDFELALNDLPSSINGTYSQTMDRIKRQAKDDRDLAFNALKWVLHAHRILSIEELRHALAIRPEICENDIDEDFLCAIEDIVSACAGLIEVEHESKTVRLVHLTAEKYFLHTAEPWFTNAHLDIAKACIEYLCQPVMQNRKHYSSIGELFSLFPLSKYAMNNIAFHLRSCITAENALVCLQHLNMLQVSQVALHHILQSLRSLLRRPGPDVALRPKSFKSTIKVPPVHVAASFCLQEVVKIICDENTNASTEFDSYENTPIHTAACLEDLASVKELLGAKGNLNAYNFVDEFGGRELRRTPLHYGIDCRDLKKSTAITKLLLDAGADPNVKFVNARGVDTSPLGFVSDNGKDCVELATLLVDHGADLSVSEGRNLRTPLSKNNSHFLVLKT